MNASEANAIAKKVNTECTKNSLSVIQKKITHAASKGEYAITIYNSIRQEVKDALKADGYKLREFDDPRDQTSGVTITW